MKNILLAGISFLFAISVQAQNGVTLKMNLEKNRIYRFRSASEQTVTQTINGVQQNTETKVSYSMSLKKVDETPDFMVTEVRFDTLITITNTMGKVVSVSSVNGGDITSGETGDVLSCIMNRLSRNALYVKIDYSGKPLEIINAAILPALVLKDTASISLKGPAALALKKQAAETVSEVNLKSMIAQFTHYLPGGPVAGGDQWTIIQKLTSGGMMLDITTTYKLDGTDGHMAGITAESAIKASDNATPIESGGVTVTYNDLKGMSRATMKVDANTGLRVDETGKTHIAGNLGISGPGFSMQMPMEINGETKISAIQ